MVEHGVPLCGPGLVDLSCRRDPLAEAVNEVEANQRVASRRGLIEQRVDGMAATDSPVMLRVIKGRGVPSIAR